MSAVLVVVWWVVLALGCGLGLVAWVAGLIMVALIARDLLRDWRRG